MTDGFMIMVDRRGGNQGFGGWRTRRYGWWGNPTSDRSTTALYSLGGCMGQVAMGTRTVFFCFCVLRSAG